MNGLLLISCLLILCCLLGNGGANPVIIDEFSNYGPEYSTNNPEGAPWDISSPFYSSFWGYDQPYWGYYNTYGW